MIANMMMYQRPELEDAHNTYWQLIRQYLLHAGINAPRELSQAAEEFTVWNHPELVLSQTCGMPYRLWLHEKVQLVGTPDYGLENCPPGYYRSALVVRRNDSRNHLTDFREAIFAYNQSFSQSGYAAPYWHIKPLGFWFEKRLHTEQHLASASSVAQGRADIASLDAVTWRLIQQHERFAENLRVLDWTTPTPGLPLITSKGHNATEVYKAVECAITELSTDHKNLLGLKGIERIPKERYLAIPNPPQTSST